MKDRAIGLKCSIPAVSTEAEQGPFSLGLVQKHQRRVISKV